MSFQWLKRFMPRGLYGRAALILILPVVTLQLVVSVVFIQRHFEGVTRQMTDTISRELRLVLSEVAAAPTAEAARDAALVFSAPLGMVLQFDAEPEDDQRRWYDFSGLVVTQSLQQNVSGVQSVQLPNDSVAHVLADTRHGLLRITFSRHRVSASNPHQLLVNMVFFGVLMTLIAFVYLRNQLRPITRLSRAAEAFGKGRNVPYSPSGAIEVRAAGKAFLAMRARIERHLEQRTLMLSGVSHDLRTPLTRLKLGLSMLEDDERAALERDVEDMQRLLDEFLSFARGASEDEAVPTDAVALVELIVKDCARAGQNVELGDVQVDAGADGLVPLRDVGVRRAVENLVNNAVRYGTKARVSLRQTSKTFVISVEDDGPGIPADQWEEALKPFARLDAARNQDKGSGVGLGLAIANDVARAHGGALRLGASDTLGGLSAELVLAR